jgi:hypothetical protein
LSEFGWGRANEGNIVAPARVPEASLFRLPFAKGRIDGLAAVMRDVAERFQEMQALRRKLAQVSAQKDS